MHGGHLPGPRVCQGNHLNARRLDPRHGLGNGDVIVEKVLQTVSGIDSRHDSDCGMWVISLTDETIYPADDFVAAAAALHSGDTYVASTNPFHTDVAERDLLHRLGFHSVLGVGVPDQPLGYLLRLYFELERTDLDVIAPIIRVLAHHCACRSCHHPQS